MERPDTPSTRIPTPSTSTSPSGSVAGPAVTAAASPAAQIAELAARALELKAFKKGMRQVAALLALLSHSDPVVRDAAFTKLQELRKMEYLRTRIEETRRELISNPDEAASYFADLDRLTLAITKPLPLPPLPYSGAVFRLTDEFYKDTPVPDDLYPALGVSPADVERLQLRTRFVHILRHFTGAAYLLSRYPNQGKDFTEMMFPMPTAGHKKDNDVNGFFPPEFNCGELVKFLDYVSTSAVLGPLVELAHTEFKKGHYKDCEREQYNSWLAPVFLWSVGGRYMLVGVGLAVHFEAGKEALVQFERVSPTCDGLRVLSAGTVRQLLTQYDSPTDFCKAALEAQRAPAPQRGIARARTAPPARPGGWSRGRGGGRGGRQ